jgi:hypothetical protein
VARKALISNEWGVADDCINLLGLGRLEVKKVSEP